MGSNEPTFSYSKGSSLNCIIFFVPTNRYGHPHEETLMRLEETGAKVLRTDEAGAIRVLFGDGEVSVLKYGRRTH